MRVLLGSSQLCEFSAVTLGLSVNSNLSYLLSYISSSGAALSWRLDCEVKCGTLFNCGFCPYLASVPLNNAPDSCETDSIPRKICFGMQALEWLVNWKG